MGGSLKEIVTQLGPSSLPIQKAVRRTKRIYFVAQLYLTSHPPPPTLFSFQSPPICTHPCPSPLTLLGQQRGAGQRRVVGRAGCWHCWHCKALQRVGWTDVSCGQALGRILLLCTAQVSTRAAVGVLVVCTRLGRGGRHGVRARCVPNGFYNRPKHVVCFLEHKWSLWSNGNKAAVLTSAFSKIAVLS